MQGNGMLEDQVSQVRGIGVQNPLKPDDPADDSNRRVSFIVQYQPAPEMVPGAEGASGAAGASGARAASGGAAVAVAPPKPTPVSDTKKK